MNTETLRTFCLSLPAATEDIKWGHDLCFLIAGRMFTVTSLESTNGNCAFKCTPEKFAELIELDGIIPAPYMARNHWVMLEKYSALRDAEIKDLVRESYKMVLAKLPKKIREEVARGGKKPPAKRRSR
jgi:predicted DNA-binding protein (MmcQ/YjbR family)